MRGRAAVAVQAMKAAMEGLDPSISRRQAAQAGAAAAEDAYDVFAGAQASQLTRLQRCFSWLLEAALPGHRPDELKD